MKKGIVFTGMFILIISAIVGCKKGENDPFLSLRTRKARITGEWTLVEGINVETSTTSGGTSVSTTLSYTDSTSTWLGETVPYTKVLSLDKKGNFEIRRTRNGVEKIDKGVWFFAGKVKEQGIKNKEAIVLSLQEQSETGVGTFNEYDGFLLNKVIMIDRLKNDEMIIKGESSSTASNGYTETLSYEERFEKQ